MATQDNPRCNTKQSDIIETKQHYTVRYNLTQYKTRQHIIQDKTGQYNTKHLQSNPIQY